MPINRNDFITGTGLANAIDQITTTTNTLIGTAGTTIDNNWRMEEERAHRAWREQQLLQMLQVQYGVGEIEERKGNTIEISEDEPVVEVIEEDIEIDKDNISEYKTVRTLLEEVFVTL